MDQDAQIKDAEQKIIKATIRHYFNAKDECAPGLAYGWECTLCKAVQELERIVTIQELERIVNGVSFEGSE